MGRRTHCTISSTEKRAGPWPLFDHPLPKSSPRKNLQFHQSPAADVCKLGLRLIFSALFALCFTDSQVYDVPTITLNVSASDFKPEEADDDVYSVPTLPGVPLGTGESTTSTSTSSSGGLQGEDAAPPGEVYRVPAPGKRISGDSSEPDCGIYDMPALSVDALPHSLSSSSAASTCTPRRLSVSSNGSGDVHWRATLSGLVHSLLSAASCPAPAMTSRDLATSLADLLSTWKASHSDDPPPPLQQAWARLADLLPALSAIGNAPPSDGLLVLVQRSLEESALLLQAQGRPRLPSQESLSRRPLPALPVQDGKASAGGMGSRKGSWIQERPLPPTPQPAFPLPHAPSTVTLTVGPADGEDDPSNEYAGIGLTPVPAPVPTGDSVGYVKLQVSFYFLAEKRFLQRHTLSLNLLLKSVEHTCLSQTIKASSSPSSIVRVNLSRLLTPSLRMDKCKPSLPTQGYVCPFFWV